jgi:pimeloyl-ACP methyl ester carboxylesterase
MAYAGYDAAADAVVVAFRGTDSRSWGNWINNLKTWRMNKLYPVPGAPKAMVHAGVARWRACVGLLLPSHSHARSLPFHLRSLVHSLVLSAGFFDLWTRSALQSNLTDAVGAILQEHPTPRLYITGHSMGGALGDLAALDLKFMHNFTEVYILMAFLLHYASMRTCLFSILIPRV